MRTEDVGTAKVSLYSFGKKDTKLPTCQFVWDVSNFRDPTGQPSMRELNGLSSTVQSFVADDPRIEGMLDSVILTIKDQLGGSDPSKWVSIGVCDVHGERTSVAVVELLSMKLDHVLPKLPYLVRHFKWLAPKDRV